MFLILNTRLTKHLDSHNGVSELTLDKLGANQIGLEYDSKDASQLIQSAHLCKEQFDWLLRHQANTLSQ